MPRFRLFRVAGALLAAVLLFAPFGPASAQSPPAPCAERLPLYASYADFRADLEAVAALPDDDERRSRLDALWQRLRAHGQIPFAVGDSVAFLYRGAAGSVEWNGDFNGWGDQKAPGRRLAGTDVWLFEHVLPADARVDYKLVVDGRWVMDPANPLVMWSGFGPNSELRMPAYAYPYATIRGEGVPRGTLTPNLRLASSALGYDVQYRVYLPAGYADLSELSTLYVTDGHEYSPDFMGSLTAVLDNTIAEGSVAPLAVVFIDPRDPRDLGKNRRMSEYKANPVFLAFVADELVPQIDADYRTRSEAGARGILGTSMGGLNAAYFGAARPGVFGNLGIQSPAFWTYPEIYGMYDQAPPPGLRLYVTQGTIRDGNGGAQLREGLDRWGYDYVYVERAEGHSWGQWRGLLADMLRHFYPGPRPEARPSDAHAAVCTAATGVEDEDMGDGPLPAGALKPFTLSAAHPSPFRSSTTFSLRVASPQHVRVDVYDVLGRRVAALFDGHLTPGAAHTFTFEAGGLPNGLYVYRAAGPVFADGKAVLLQK